MQEIHCIIKRIVLACTKKLTAFEKRPHRSINGFSERKIY